MAQRINEGITGAEAAQIIYENDSYNESLAMTAVKTLGVENILQNPFFKDGLDPWERNENTFTFDIVDGYAHVNTTGSDNAGIIQPLYFEVGEYLIETRVKKNNDNPTILQFYSFPGDSLAQVVLEDTQEWVTYYARLNITAAGTKSFVYKINGVNSDISIDYVLFMKSENSLTGKISEMGDQVSDNTQSIGFVNMLKNPKFTQGFIEWEKNEAELTLSMQNGLAKIDATGTTDPAIYQTPVSYIKGKTNFSVRYKKLSAGNASFRLGTTYQGAMQVKNVTSSDWETFSFDTDFSADGSGLFMFAPSPNSIWIIEWFKVQVTEDGSLAWRVSELEKDTSKWTVPPINLAMTPYKEYLSPFIDLYLSRASDVTVAQIGDSISTNLKWSPDRPDANERPPFMTEFNFNSYAEEKLRWQDQKYRRFDYAGVFTEILGGGASSARETDADNWGPNGGAYYYPITKVIDGGTGSGVSFKMPSGQKRLSLIVHTDKAFAAETAVTISSGNGKVEVFDGDSWVEANGYTTSFKESDTMGTLGFYTDNAQKRLKFRSLADLTEKTITVKNVGAGRFGYWGIEYSPNQYMFTYIAASKGSHNDATLKKYESFMVDSFEPDLIIYQCPVLNSGFGTARATGSNSFGGQFATRYNELKAKGYLVLSYVAWAATYSNFVDNNGNFLYSVAGNGEIVTCQNDAANISYNFKQLSDGAPFINCFPIITEIAKEKAEIEQGNIYYNALAGSGKDGGSFTIDGIHLNKRGELILWRILESILNF